MQIRAGVTVPAAVLAALVAVSAVAPAGADDRVDRARTAKRNADAGARDAKADLAESSQRLARAEASYALLERQIPIAKADLATARGELAAARAQDAEAARRLVEAEQAERVAQQRLAATAERLANQQDQVAGLVQHSYQHGGSMALPMLGAAMTAGSYSDFADSMIYLDQITAAQGAIIARMRAERAQLATDTKTLALRRDEVAAQRAQAASRLGQTEQLAARAEAARDRVEALLDQQRDVVRRARRDRAADQARYEEMQAESRRLERVIAAEMSRSKHAGSGSSANAPTGGKLLSYPARGRISSPFGMRFHPILRYRKLHTGVDFALAPGTKVGAARYGRVIESYFHGAYGNRVVVSHGYVRGVHLTTTYNHLSVRWVSAGDRVSRGETVGLSGNTGWSTGPHLHFEVLVNGQFRNPMRWL